MTEVRCPGCRRRVPAELLYLVPGHGEACDACRERLFRTGMLARADYLCAVGAPPDLVARAESS